MGRNSIAPFPRALQEQRSWCFSSVQVVTSKVPFSVVYYAAIGDAIAAVGPCSAIASAGQVELRSPPPDPLWLTSFGWFCPKFGRGRGV